MTNKKENKKENFFRKTRRILNEAFNFRKSYSVDSKITDTLPESIEEIRCVVNSLVKIIKNFEKENDKLSSHLLHISKTNKFLIIISIASIVVNIILILSI